MARRLPRWVGLIVFPVQLGTVHLGIPLELSRHGRRHGWENVKRRPGVANVLGLVPLAAGTALVAWSIAEHYEAAPAESWAIRRSLQPEYLLTEGPYRVSRHPMHVGGVAIWSGWAAWFGSAPIAAGMFVLTAVYRAAIEWEERMLERRWGDDWRAYATRTSRWLSVRSVLG